MASDTCRRSASRRCSATRLPGTLVAQFGPEPSVSGTGTSEGLSSALYNLSGEDQAVGIGITF